MVLMIFGAFHEFIFIGLHEVTSALVNYMAQGKNLFFVLLFAERADAFFKV